MKFAADYGKKHTLPEQYESAFRATAGSASMSAETSNKAKLNILMFVQGCQVGRERGFSWDFGRGWLPRTSYLNLI